MPSPAGTDGTGPASSGRAIETDGLTKRYGDVDAVVDLDLSIDHGQIYGFLGPNGSGKTTTMRLLTTLLTPTSGRAWIDGVPVSDRPRAIQRLGYLPEEPPIFDELTGREQLRYVADLSDVPAAVADERIQDYLERFDLAEDADRRIESYSKGMRQKLGIVQAVLDEPPVVLLDEPTSGLDPRAARAVKDLIGDLADRETTIFLSTHILPVVDELADVVGVLSDGRMVAEDDPVELKSRAEAGTSSTLEDVFLDVTASHEEAGEESDTPEAAAGR
jgi:ABC-2 type transport system ATP-binding protein